MVAVTPAPACTPPSPTDKSCRANRAEKRFVVSSKGPRALAKDNNNKRPVSDVATHPAPLRKKRAQDIEKANILYKTIKAINMPPRSRLVPGQLPPIPTAGTSPFGDTEDYHNSVIINFLAETEHTYGSTTILFNEFFPKDSITDEAIRRRHIRSLQRLLKKHGPKPVDQIEELGKNVMKRGKARAPRLSGIVLEHDQLDVAMPSPDDAATTCSVNITPAPPPPAQLRKRVDREKSILRARRREALKDRDFDKTCIAVWKDAEGLEFLAIRDKLDKERKWHLGLATIEKYYYQTLDWVYDTIGMDTGFRQYAVKDGIVTSRTRLRESRRV